jgi:AcrR family transcriptional regulator
VSRPDRTGAMAERDRAPYASRLRSEQARATRRTIVAAASDLFVEKGYAATTIDAVAERAGVGRKTVFSSVGGKGALLKLAWDWAVVGDDESVPMSERPAVQAILGERDPGRVVRMWVDMQLEAGARAAPIGAVVIAAADVDADARELLDLIRRESLAGATAFVTHLAGVGGLRSDVTVERAAEGCWALINSLLQHLLVAKSGWSLQEYGEWLARLAATMLLESERTAPAGRPPTVRTVHRPEQERYEALIGHRIVGQLFYQRTEQLVVITRTDVDAAFEDSGVAGTLVRRALDDVRADATRRVVPLCHYTAWWINRHHDYASLLFEATAD